MMVCSSLLVFLVAAAPAQPGRPARDGPRRGPAGRLGPARDPAGGKPAGARGGRLRSRPVRSLRGSRGGAEPVDIASARRGSRGPGPRGLEPGRGRAPRGRRGVGQGRAAGEETVLLAATTDADAEVRAQAALALFRMRFLKRVPEYSTAAASKLSLLTADPEAEVAGAQPTRRRIGLTRMAKALAVCARDADPRVRLFSVRALGKKWRGPEDSSSWIPTRTSAPEAVGALRAAKAWSRLSNSSSSMRRRMCVRPPRTPPRPRTMSRASALY